MLEPEGFRLLLPRSLYQGMLAHVTGALPLEAVGLLGGAGGQVSRQVPLPNLLGKRRFLVDPYAQFQALRQFKAEGLVPVAVYHSHPGGGTGLSPEDLLFAQRLPYLQVVIAVGRPLNPAVEMAAYRVEDWRVEQVPIAVGLEEEAWR